MFRFHEHEVVLPVVVITELEAKRTHPELGYFARTALRLLDDLRLQHGALHAPVPLADGDRCRWSSTTPTRRRFQMVCGWATTTPASRPWRRISPPRVARWWSSARTYPCASRRRWSAWPPRSTEPNWPFLSGWTGMAELDVDVETVNDIYANEVVDVDDARDLPCHTGVVMVTAGQRAGNRDTGQAGAAGAR